MSHYLHVIFLVQLVGGVLLLSGQFIPLALVLLGPVLVQHPSLSHFFLPPVFRPGCLRQSCGSSFSIGVRRAFAGIFAQKV